MTLVAGIDSSTQSCKVVIRDAASGALVRSGRAAHPDGTEVDPGAWWVALGEAIADAGGLADVSALSVAGQQHGMVALDAAGRVIRPALLWNDTRSAAAADDLVAEVGAEEYARRSGVVPVASFTASKLRWLRDAEPANAATVAAVALPHDWLVWRLRGCGPAESSPRGPALELLCTDRSDASGTAYWSPTTGEYDRELLRLALGHDAVLPRVLGPAEHAGTVHPVIAERFGAADPAADIVLGAGAGDNAGAALGLDAVAGDVVVSIGTSGTVFAVTDAAASDASGTVAGFADASGRFLPLIATLNAARVLDAVAGLLGVDHAELGELALQAEAGSGGAVLVPWFEGERTPNLPRATAGFDGLTLANSTRPNLARAAIEGMLCGLADGLDAVRAQGVSAERIILIGGAAQNPAVQRIAAQIFDAPVVVPTPGEYVADGAARQARWALDGERPNWAVTVAARPTPEHHPVIREQYAAARAARAARFA
ncbi:xylulokinase [Microterricola gilva]|uniref:Xylulose kinase n=1 Tax=Microterricola gilva TaxID=393267 RepID=A0A4Q8AP26_9MICO|nr:xylulokinase [Microterricola gilva]RZU66367.1 xylulokinase [Microterricola gilva]